MPLYAVCPKLKHFTWLIQSLTVLNVAQTRRAWLLAATGQTFDSLEAAGLVASPKHSPSCSGIGDLGASASLSRPLVSPAVPVRRSSGVVAVVKLIA